MHLKVGNAFDISTVCMHLFGLKAALKSNFGHWLAALLILSQLLGCSPPSPSTFSIRFVLFFRHSGNSSSSIAATLGTQPQMHFNVKFLNKYLHNLQARLAGWMVVVGAGRGVAATRFILFVFCTGIQTMRSQANCARLESRNSVASQP